jgi:hypothetical protein
VSKPGPALATLPRTVRTVSEIPKTRNMAFSLVGAVRCEPHA